MKNKVAAKLEAAAAAKARATRTLSPPEAKAAYNAAKITYNSMTNEERPKALVAAGKMYPEAMALANKPKSRKSRKSKSRKSKSRKSRR